MKKELATAAEYFPYIGHELNHKKQGGEWIYRASVGKLMRKENITWLNEDQVVIKGQPEDLFRQVEVNGLAPHRTLARDPQSVEVVVPRHRTLYDYTIGQPIHHDLVNPEVLLLAGNNLFVFPFNEALRIFGAFIFLRGDATLKRKGYAPVFLSQKRYIDEVFPAYLTQQMITGTKVGDRVLRRDFLMYPEQEKNPQTKKRGGGRTKTGKLRNLSHILFDKLKNITRDSTVKLYVTAVNVSFSKVPEVPYIVHPIQKKGFWKNLGYIREQIFIYGGYPRYARRHPEAKVDAVVHYGAPTLLDSGQFHSMRDLLRFSMDLKHKIGMLETIFPIPFLYRVMDEDEELSLAEFESRAAALFARYEEQGIDTHPISASEGRMLPAKEIIERSMLAQNSNPPFHLRQMKTRLFLSFHNGRLRSHDRKVHDWYANNIRHLDE